MASHPLVTVAIPLYRSSPWVRNILANIANVDYPNVEIIISDRHCADDALVTLMRQLREDPRIRFLRATDGLNWVAHYNHLITCASGKYLLWMPHDDLYPRGYVPRLAAALEDTPTAILAYGRMECESTGPAPLAPRQLRLPSGESRAWSPRDAGRLFSCGNNAGVAFRGLFRRERVVESALYIRPTASLEMADEYWLLALGLLGSFRFVPACVCTKRFYTGSTHSVWQYSYRARLHGMRVVHSYLRDHCPLRWDRAAVMWRFSSWTLRRMFDPLRR